MTTQLLPLTPGYSARRIEERIRAFEEMGVHRTGWPADDQASRWLLGELRRAGITAERDRFAFPRVEYRGARLTIADRQIEGVPLYDAEFTEYGGISGELCESGDADPFGKIVVAPGGTGAAEWRGPALAQRIADLASRGAVGVVLPQGDRDGQIALRNAVHLDRPHTLPALQIAARDGRALRTTIMIGAEGILEVDGERLRSTATNVTATIAGTDPEADAIGIVTPKSGWYACAAERGGGIAIWLALAESLIASGAPRRTVHLLASSGHELDFWGIRSYARVHRERLADAAAWLHLGASLGASEGAGPIVAASDRGLAELAAGAVAHAEIEGVTEREPGPAAGGEARILSEAGTSYVSFLGPHAYFHSAGDTFDRAVDAGLAARWALAAREVLEGLLRL